jgi:hypothetical protein
LLSELMKCFYIARHLAAKFGTNSVILIWWVLFVIDDVWFEVVLFFFWGFLLISAIFIGYGWFSVVKILLISPLFCSEVCEVLCLCCLLELIWNFNNFDLVFCGLCWGLFLGYRRVVFSWYLFFICCFADYYLMRCFHIARYLAA